MVIPVQQGVSAQLPDDADDEGSEEHELEYAHKHRIQEEGECGVGGHGIGQGGEGVYQQDQQQRHGLNVSALTYVLPSCACNGSWSWSWSWGCWEIQAALRLRDKCAAGCIPGGVRSEVEDVAQALVDVHGKQSQHANSGLRSVKSYQSSVICGL